MTGHFSNGELQLGLKLIKQEKETKAYYVEMWKKPPESPNTEKV